MPDPDQGRCTALSHTPYDTPAGARDVVRLERSNLHFTTWKGGPCEVNSRLPIPPVWVWDLATGELRERTFPDNVGVINP